LRGVSQEYALGVSLGAGACLETTSLGRRKAASFFVRALDALGDAARNAREQWWLTLSTRSTWMNNLIRESPSVDKEDAVICSQDCSAEIAGRRKAARLLWCARKPPALPKRWYLSCSFWLGAKLWEIPGPAKNAADSF